MSSFEIELIEQGPAAGLRVARFRNRGQPQKRALIVQGRAEFIEKYAESAGRLADMGFDVWTYDLRGQGGSQRFLADPLKGHLADFANYLHDLQAVMQLASVRSDKKPGADLLLSHSTGGLVAARALADKKTMARQAVFSSPFFGLAGGWATKVAALVLADSYVRFGWHERYLPGQERADVRDFMSSASVLTRDAERYRRAMGILLERPELAIGGVTAGWLAACFAAQRLLKRDLQRGLPSHWPQTAMYLGGADRVVCNITNRQLAKLMKIEPVEMPGARHELLIETDEVQERLWSHMGDFLRKSD